MESLKEFLENSTIHGLCHISTSRFTTSYVYYISNISNSCYILTSRLTISNLQYINIKYQIFANISNLCHKSNRSRAGKFAWFFIVCISLATHSCKKIIFQPLKKQKKLVEWIQLCQFVSFVSERVKGKAF